MDKEKDLKNIVKRFIEGESNPNELDEAIRLFSDPYHNLELRPVIYDLWEKHDSEQEIGLSNEENQIILDKIHHKISLNSEPVSQNDTRNLLKNVVRIAAILVIGVVSGIFIKSLEKKETIYHTTIAPLGAISQVVMPDSTIIYLNAGTELKYPGSKNKNREVYLKGEAWFNVKTNKNSPFIVHTSFYNVRVTGTKFNVKAYEEDNEVITTLEEGSVDVISSEGLKLNETKNLQPGEQLIYKRLQRSIEIKRVNPRMFTSWKDNQLIFINMNLRELIVLLERKYGVSIRTPEKSILNYHYDGTISDESILEVLDLLKSTLPIRYVIEGQTIVIEKE